jgi:hypothetical protein
MTWFRREPEVVWLAGFGDEPAIQAAAIARVEETLPGFARLDSQGRLSPRGLCL